MGTVTSRRASVLVLTIVCGTGPFLTGVDVGASQRSKDQTTRNATSGEVTRPQVVSESVLRRIRARVGKIAELKQVTTPSRGVVRIALDQTLVKEQEYRATLAAACDAILEARAEQRVDSIEIVNTEARQGFVYRPASSCEDVVSADAEGRRLAIVPGTSVFRARR